MAKKARSKAPVRRKKSPTGTSTTVKKKVAGKAKTKKKAIQKKSPKIATAMRAAIQNIANYGDTDIFPFSFEQHVFRDTPHLVQTCLEELHADFDTQITQNPPENINTLAPVGYSGFRWATQIDPLWNAYYLGLVIDMGPSIEAARIPVSEDTVFSYRFVDPVDGSGIFDDGVTWRCFMDTSKQVAADFSHVLLCDVSDFYARIYHHRVENALKWLNEKPDTVRRIVEVLKVFSGTVSYGLPVGGPASRLLAELALNSVDKLLRAHGIRFCRYVDDYRIFCNSKEEAFQRLIFLSDKLFNEGLALQKNKTRILTAKEFQDETRIVLKTENVNDENLTDEDKLLRLSIRFDPYSDTSVDDYNSLKEEVAKVDIAGILGRELEKTRIDSTVTKQAIAALRMVGSREQKGILESLLQIHNLNTLAPVFPRLMTVLRGLYVEVDEPTQELIDEALTTLIESESHIIQVDLNLAFAIQVMRRRVTQKTETLFVKLFKQSASPLVRREIIIAWADWGHNHSLTDLKKYFQGLSRWERRAFIVGSFGLKDEGKHWRDHNRRSFDPEELVIRDWCADRVSTKPNVPL